MAKKETKAKKAEDAALIQSKISDAKNWDDLDRKKIREKTTLFFEGGVDLKDREGRSTYVSRDLADAHGFILPSMMRIFLGSTRIVEFLPKKPEHEEYSDQVTDYINYKLKAELDIYSVLRDGMYEGLLRGNGIIKYWWDETEEKTLEDFTGQTEQAFKQISNDPEIEYVEDVEAYEDPEFQMPQLPEGVTPETLVLAAQKGDQAAVNMLKAMQVPTLYDFTVCRVEKSGKLCVESIPEEDFLIESTAIKLDNDIGFCAHKRKVTRSDLVTEGYDKSKVDKLPVYHTNVDDEERNDNHDSHTFTAADKSMEQVIVYECYIKLDKDEDGIAERYRVVIGERQDTCLLWEEWADDLPFVDIVPMPKPFVWRGGSLFDETQDVQRIKTTSVRGILDNVYDQLNPRMDVEKDAYLNPNELKNPTFGGVLWRRQGRPPAQPVVSESIGADVQPVLSLMDEIAERRTGISKRTTALDADTLQNQSATAVNAMTAATQAVAEEYARNIAEHGGLKRLFKCILKLIIKNAKKGEVYKLRGEWIQVDPRAWDAEMDVEINTGLGTGSRERDFAMLQGVAANQEKIAMQFGPFNEKLNVGHILETYQKMAEAAGLRNGELYYPSMTQEEVAQMRQQQAEAAKNKPDPEMMKLQVQAQADAMKAKVKAEVDMTVKDKELAQAFRLKEMEMAAQRDKENAQAQADIIVDEKRKETEALLAAQEIEYKRARDAKANEIEMAKLETKIKIEMARLDAQNSGDENNSNGNANTMLAELLQTIQAQMVAPKRLIKDENGDIIGAETIL